jgi:hypothetical protein
MTKAGPNPSLKAKVSKATVPSSKAHVHDMEVDKKERK